MVEPSVETKLRLLIRDALLLSLRWYDENRTGCPLRSFSQRFAVRYSHIVGPDEALRVPLSELLSSYRTIISDRSDVPYPVLLPFVTPSGSLRYLPRTINSMYMEMVGLSDEELPEELRGVSYDPLEAFVSGLMVTDPITREKRPAKGPPLSVRARENLMRIIERLSEAPQGELCHDLVTD